MFGNQSHVGKLVDIQYKISSLYKNTQKGIIY